MKYKFVGGLLDGKTKEGDLKNLYTVPYYDGKGFLVFQMYQRVEEKWGKGCFTNTFKYYKDLRG